MPTLDPAVCLKCQSAMTSVFKNKKRAYVCVNCKSLEDPIKTPEAAGWVHSELKPPK